MSSVTARPDDTKLSSGNSPDGHDPVPSMVDWILGILAVVVGFGLSAVSIGLYTMVDKATIRDAVTDEGVQVEGLTQSELVSAGATFMDWLAVGLGLTGLALIVLAVVSVRARRQTRRRVAREGGSTATFLPCAVYGATAGSVISSAVPGIGAIVGGGLGAYLYDGENGVRLGAATGLVAIALQLPVVVFIGIGFVAAGAAISHVAAGTTLAGLVVLTALVGTAINAGLGALGGFLADRFV